MAGPNQIPFRPPSPQLLAVSDFLEDGEWHTMDELYRAVGHVIPAGKAHRRGVIMNERQVKARRAKGMPPGTPRPRSDEAIIATGRKAILRDVLNGRSVDEEVAFETRGVRGSIEVRMRFVPPSVIEHRRRGMFDPHELADRLVETPERERGFLLDDLDVRRLRTLVRVLVDRVGH